MKLLRDVNVHLEDKRKSRTFFFYLFFMYALVCMTKNCFSGALAAIVDEESMTLSQTTFISASFYIFYTPLQIVGGVLADRFGTARLILIGLVGNAVSNIVIFYNQNYYVMLIAWIFSAIAQSALWPAVFKTYSSQLLQSDKTFMIFMMSFAASLGLVCSYLFAAILPRWQYNFAVSAIVLILLSVGLLVFCRVLDPHLKKDERPKPTDPIAVEETPKGKQVLLLFLTSGFLLSLPAALIRYIVDNSTKTYTPTLLTQSYPDISPSIGNLLTILVIISGLAGTLTVRFLLYPRLFKNEFTCTLALLLCVLPLAVMMTFVGRIPASLYVALLCLLSLLLTGTSYLANCFTARFAKYKLNGTAAGLLNAAYSFGLVLQYIVFGRIAENFGWGVVTTLWVVMIAISAILIALTIRPSIRFKRKIHE